MNFMEDNQLNIRVKLKWANNVTYINQDCFIVGKGGLILGD